MPARAPNAAADPAPDPNAEAAGAAADPASNEGGQGPAKAVPGTHDENSVPLRSREGEEYEATAKSDQALGASARDDGTPQGEGSARARMSDPEEQVRSVDMKLITKTAEKAAQTGYLDLSQIAGSEAASVADIVESSEDFHYSASILAATRTDYPMVQLASVGWAPLDLARSVSSQGTIVLRQVEPTNVPDLARKATDEIGRTRLPFTTVPVAQARRSFGTLLADFLRVRIEAALGLRGVPGDEPPIGTPEAPGLDVTVHSRRPSLRIHYLCAYFPGTQTVFGNSLSTPVRGFLRPGRYIFGADGSNFQLVIEDKIVYEIPPTDTVYLLRA